MQEGTGDRYKIENILNTDGTFHCSSKGLKFVLSLRLKDASEFQLSHLALKAAMRCTSQLKTGIFFVTDAKLSAEELAVFDEAAVADLPALVAQQDFGRQACVFTVADEDGQVEVEVMETSPQWFRGRYLTIKYIDAHGDNENIDVGTLGIIGSLDLECPSVKLGPVAAQFGVVKGPAPLVNKVIEDDEVKLINSRKCLLFLSTDEVAYVESIATAYKNTLTTFLVDGHTSMATSLNNYLFGKQLNDTVVITDMSGPNGPKGYQLPKALSASTETEVCTWVDLISTNAQLFDDVDAFAKEFEQLAKLLAAKEQLSSAQSNHEVIAANIAKLRTDMLADIGAAAEQLDALRVQ